MSAAGRAALSLTRGRARRWSLAGRAPVLIIVPPVASLYIPSLAAHTLQACAREAGYDVEVLYANLLLAELIGEDAYNEVAWEPIGPLAAERLFARWAFNLPPLGHHAEQMFEFRRMFGEKQATVYTAALDLAGAPAQRKLTQQQRAAWRRLSLLEPRVGEWLDEVAAAVAEGGYRCVGCTTTFEQTVCSIALLDRIKRLRGDVVTIIGGANCEAEMADGILSLGSAIDYVFSGESDETFVPFIRALLDGQRPSSPIIRGRPCKNMDERPTPRFVEFFGQRDRALPGSLRRREATFLSYETSRGCWWGQKQHCTFCGLNGEGMASRRKSAERVLQELRTLVDDHPTRNIGMADNIMPHEYFRTLLPQLSEEVPRLTIFYEQKANLTLAQVVALKEAGVTTIQPGIEALSSPMLRLMKKGVQAWQNLLLLRYARIAGIRTMWAILCGFPGDSADMYRETLRIARLSRHLPPPAALWHLTIDRFSPYFMHPADFGIKSIAPYPGYGDIFPARANLEKLAYHFVGEYESAADQNLDLMRELGMEIDAWRRAWRAPYRRRPELKIERHNGCYALFDTRGIAGAESVRDLSEQEAAHLLFHRRFNDAAEQRAAIERSLAVVVDGWFVPLPVARIDVLRELMAGQAETKDSCNQLDSLGRKRNQADVAQGLRRIACSGPIAPLDHPLAPA